MKKILSVLVLISFLTVLAIPMVTSAQAEVPQECCQIGRDITVDDTECSEDDWVGPADGECDETITCETNKWGMFCLLNAIYTVTDWIFIILVAVAAVMVLWGAFTLLTAAGAPEKVTSGRNYIIYAVIGLAVGLLSKAIPAIVRVVLGA